MKPTDLTPNKIEEAPMGALSKVGNYLGSKLPTFAPDLANRATGNLNTGAVANQAWASYQQYLGQTEGVSAKPTKKSVLAWLKFKKYSPNAINAAEQVIDKSETAKTAKTATDAADAEKAANLWHAQYESKKPAHHLDIMRSYLDILSEKTLGRAGAVADQFARDAAAKAAAAKAAGGGAAKAAGGGAAKAAGGGAAAPAAGGGAAAPAAGGGAAAPAAPAADPAAAAPTTAPAPAAAPAAPAASTGELTSKVASQAIMAAAQAQAAEQYNEPQAAAVSNTGAGAAAGGGGGDGGNTATTVDQLYNKGGTKSATDPHTMAGDLYAILDPLSKGGDQRAQRLNTALDAYIQSAPRAESLNFSESFNPGKMLEKKVTKLTRIK